MLYPDNPFGAPLPKNSFYKLFKLPYYLKVVNISKADIKKGYYTV